MWYNMLGAIIAVTFFFYKSVAQVEVICGNKETQKNSHTSMHIAFRTDILHTYSPHLYPYHSFTSSKYILRLLIETIFLYKKTSKTQREKKSPQCIGNKSKSTYKFRSQLHKSSRLPFNIELYLFPYYTIYWNFNMAIHKSCFFYIGDQDGMQSAMIKVQWLCCTV